MTLLQAASLRAGTRVAPTWKESAMAMPQLNVAATTPHAKYDRLIAKAQQVPAATTVVVHPCDESSLRGPVEAAELGIIIPILVGPKAKITANAAAHKIDISRRSE